MANEKRIEYQHSIEETLARLDEFLAKYDAKLREIEESRKRVAGENGETIDGEYHVIDDPAQLPPGPTQ